MLKKRVDEVRKLREENCKQYEFYRCMTRWIKNQINGKYLSHYMDIYGYQRIAIYGMKELGELCWLELKNSNTDVAYFIDRDADSIFSDIAAYKPTDDLPKVDIVIVSALHYYEQIREELCEKVGCPIVALDSIVDYLFENYNSIFVEES